MLDENNARCPVARALEVLGDRWALMILRDAFDGLRRFGEFRKTWDWRRTSLRHA